jgi:hypothetical protein
MGRAYSCWMLNLFVHHLTGRFLKVKPPLFVQPVIANGTIYDHPVYFIYPDVLVAVCETSHWVGG